MKRFFRLGWLLVAFLASFGNPLKAQSTVMNVLMNDGTAQTFFMDDSDRVYFSDNTYLVVEQDDAASVTQIQLADIRKITCEETQKVTDNQNPAIILTPNPAHDMVVFRNLNGSHEVRIYALSGQLVKSFEATDGQPVDVSDLPIGVYLVKTPSSTLKMMKL